LRLIKVLVAVAALAMFSAGVVRADDITGGDSRIVIGTTPPGSPTCTGFQSAANSDGTISADCTVEGSTSTNITFYVPTADLLPGPGQDTPSLSCQSSLQNIGWAATSGSLDLAGVPVSTCTFTAPTSVSVSTYAYLLLSGDPYWGLPWTANNDGDCDLDDDVLGIPVGCDVSFSTPQGASTDNGELFTDGAVFGFSPTGPGGITPFPEPTSLALLLVGLVPLAFLRRRAIQQR
jgi:hypothetical protein